jgi:cyclopropane-fatty-acyl-phospholipid synthase
MALEPHSQTSEAKDDRALSGSSLGTGSWQKRSIQTLLKEAGVAIDGPNPWDIHVRDERFYDAALRDGELGVGESYAAGWWDCEQLDELTGRILSHDLLRRVGRGWRTLWATFKHKLLNLQTENRATQVAWAHYDRSNEFFQQMLGPTMSYSCAYWRNADCLDKAQHDKHDLICRKLGVKKNDRVLDIGCGWGGFAKHAAQNYGCHVTGITISRAQHEFARGFCANLPVDIVFGDYRGDLLRSMGPFDKIVLIGMFEHVGGSNHRQCLAIAHELLKDDGLFLLQVIGGSTSCGFGAWIDRYIFPNGELPKSPCAIQLQR